jgi:LuxR family maltose regulon positive regulatory protein
MPSADLRDFAFQANGEALRKYAAELLKRDPSRTAAADSLELTAFLADCDLAGAEAKMETLKFKYQDSEKIQSIISTTNLVKAHLDFAFGRFNDLEKTINEEIATFNKGNSTLEATDILQLFRLKAQKLLFLNQYKELFELSEFAATFKEAGNKDQTFYLSNSFAAMVLAANGEHRKALELANKNLKVAELNGYKGVLAPFDSLYVKAISQMAMASPKEALQTFETLRNESLKYSQWPWHLMADGNFARDLAINNKLSEALTIIREERELIASLQLQNDLSFFPDSSELFIRYLIKDIERIETLVNRLPNTILVQQIRALKEEWSGKDMLEWIKSLPDVTAREKIYKLFAYSDYYADRESVAVDYMRKALVLVEETGSIEFLLRQHKIFDIIIKAASDLKTPFMEDMVRRITDRVKQNSENNRGDLPTPLTTRELEVVRHLATGKPISSIAASLHVSMNTMKTHLRNIYKKLEVDGREKAVEKGRELFLI